MWVNSPTNFGNQEAIFLPQRDPWIVTGRRKKEEALLRFGKRLAELRTARDLSYRQLAALCDVDASDISKFEKGEVNITLLTLMDLSIGLEVDPKELLDFEADFLRD